jgi:hypothetical protein
MILGNGGIVRLKRESGDPIQVTAAQRNVSGTGFLVSKVDGLISGDSVTCTGTGNLPITGYTTVSTASLYVHITPTGVLALTDSRIKAINGLAADLLPISSGNFGTMTITGNANTWEYPANLTKWSFRTDANPIDTTALGETFSDSVKSLVSGGGEFNEYMISRTWRDNQAGGRVVDQFIFHQLTLMTRAGSKALAQFWLKNNSGSLLPGDLYYEANIIFVASVLDNSAETAVQGSSTFVTVGEIALRAQAELVAPAPILYGCGA